VLWIGSRSNRIATYGDRGRDASDFYSAGRADFREVIDHESNTRVILYISIFFALSQEAPCDVQDISLRIVPKSHRHDVKLSGSPERCDPPELLAVQEDELSRRKRARKNNPPFF
jgi:hypothetical protein